MSLADQLKQWRQTSPYRELRRNMSLSIRDVAVVFGISEATWRGWEDGRYMPAPDKLERLQAGAENKEHCRAAADYKAKPLAVRIKEWKKKTPSF